MVASPTDQTEEAARTAGQLAWNIERVGAAMEVLVNGPLTERALLVLIKDACPSSISFADIRAVLDAAGKLKKLYVKKSTPPTKV